jgi:N-acetylneuraminic acid mutarotase
MHRRTFLSGFSLLWFATPEPSPSPGWTSRAAMPVGRSEMPAATLDGLIYVAGGFGAGARADRYDPTTDTWEQMADLPVPINHPGIAAYQQQIVVAGGYSMDGATAHDAMWAYESDSNAWEQIGDLPEPMGAFGLVTMQDDLYLVGGALRSLNGEPSAKTWRWFSREGRWEERAPLSRAREHMATVAVGGAIYAIGGRAHGRDSDELGSLVERYRPDIDAWEVLDPLPHPRSGLNGVAVCNHVVVAGGETSSRVFADVQLFNTTDGTWSALPDLPKAVHGVAIAAIEERLFAIGGSTEAGQIQNVATVSALEIGHSGIACGS